MYLNDCQRTAFYEGIGLDTKEFDMHVIIEVKMSCLFLTVPSYLHFSCHLGTYTYCVSDNSEQLLNMEIRSL